MMLFLLTALIFLIPIAEIIVLIEVGKAFGALWVIALSLATAFLGGWIIRMQGLTALYRAQKDISEGAVPVQSALDGILLVLAAPFLMTPGFLTDIVGFSLLVPGFRQWLGMMIFHKIKAHLERRSGTITIKRP